MIRGLSGKPRKGLSSVKLSGLLVLSTIWIVVILRRLGYGTDGTDGRSKHGEYSPYSPSTAGWWLGRYNGPPADQQLHAVAEKEEGRSIKPIAYVFPQFHPIPENDKFWGANFTEWTNVKDVSKNPWGIKIQKPTKEIGYYNLLDYSVRERYASLARDTGLYGFVYHHYWFGRPVMEKVLMALLEDGQPDLPFMLSWANEPWTARWDGLDGSEVLLRQVYSGVQSWREHFNWLLPFFKHPNYIRVNGKVQFMVYDPRHLDHIGKHMFVAWREWAIEEGLGGIDIIETRGHNDDPTRRGFTDAINEFGFRSSGGHDGTTWAGLNRLGNVYHRGAGVAWDNTPRHPSGGGTSNSFAHPSLWKYHVLNLMRRIKSDPNPKDQENFLFINAFNEWGEGNVLEPSKQWGLNFSLAFREATALSQALPWRDELVANAEILARNLSLSPYIPPANEFFAGKKVTVLPRDDIDVCVVIRVFTSAWAFTAPFGLAELLESLSSQQNKRWRAVVLRAAPGADHGAVRAHVLDAWDPRVALVDTPDEVLANGTDAPGPGEWVVADWAIENLERLAQEGVSECGMAKYLLVAKSNSTFAPETFNRVDAPQINPDAPEGAVAPKQGDILGLNFATRATLLVHEPVEPIWWRERCERLRPGNLQICVPAAYQEAAANDLLEADAVLLDLKKFVADQYGFQGKGMGVLQDLVHDGWTWDAPRDEVCHMVEGGSYSSCVESGRFWLDVPESSKRYKSGCYSLDSIVGQYGRDTSQWDMAGWKRNPFCLRLSNREYSKHLDVA